MYVIDNCYELNKDGFYYSEDLQRYVCFKNKVVVCLKHILGPKTFSGTLVDIGFNGTGPDIQTNNEIEFSVDDIVGEYEMKNMEAEEPEQIFFMDM